MTSKNNRGHGSQETKSLFFSQLVKKIQLIFQDEDILVINKPAGLQVHPDFRNLKGTLVDYLLAEYPEVKSVGESPERPGIVHRLDRDTSGLMIITRSNKAFQYYKNQFQTRKIQKSYWALTHGNFKENSGEVNLSIGRSPKNTVLRSTAPYAKDRKDAQTFYKVLKRFKVVLSSAHFFFYTLCEVYPKTGRTHQVRVHLKSIGHPITGDSLYKFKRLRLPQGLKRMFLVAKKIEFRDRFGKKRKFEIPLDKDLAEVLSILEKNRL